ncbi:hypothetical protein SAMN04487765_1005 [Tenacibaculum sp. MAR_2010_89]|nr:hypothetical protein SAMN04487765_1005 [Tenacibaculum sp. MAR_2010_89]
MPWEQECTEEDQPGYDDRCDHGGGSGGNGDGDD